EALTEVIGADLGETQAEAAAQAAIGRSQLSAGLRRLGARWIGGRAVSPGFAHGPALVVKTFDVAADGAIARTSRDPQIERTAVHAALHEVHQFIKSRLDSAN